MERGQLSSGQLALLILAIAGFAIAALFLFGVFENESLTDREVCRLSVLSRATVPGIIQQDVPLNCFTEKVCITADSGSFLGIGGKDNSCKQFSGEENVRNVEVKLDSFADREKALDTIQREVANSMFDCWMMTGQGKMDIFTDYSSSNVGGRIAEASLSSADLSISEIKPSCVVCSRVAFSDTLIGLDKNASDTDRILNKLDYNAFMSSEKVPGSSLTYFQAFTDESAGSGYGTIQQSEDRLARYYGKNEFTQSEAEEIKAILKQQFPASFAEIDRLNKDNLYSYFDRFRNTNPTNQIAVVFTQIKVPSNPADTQFWNTLQNGAILGGFAMVSGPGKIASFLIPGPGWVKALVEVGAIGATSLHFALESESTVKNNQALSAATCGTFESTIEGDQKGCSLVKLVNWDVNTINGLCASGIEGNL